jgi:membrane protease YdiL (CAAX protease family)
MDNLVQWIKRHQVVAFYLLTFAITWGLGFTYIAVMQRNAEWLIPLAFVATSGPALAGIILSAICNTGPRLRNRRTFWIAFGLALVLCELVFLANNYFINGTPFNAFAAVFILIAVAPVAFILSSAWSRIPAVRSYLVSLVRVRAAWIWAVVAILLVIVLFLVSLILSSVLGRLPFAAHAFSEEGFTLIGLILVKFAYQFFFFNGTGEEAGWRGFAQPRLQARTSPLIAILVLTFFWALWHLFYFQGQGLPVFTLSFWAEQFFSLTPATVLLVWLYNRSKGSILVAGVFHAAANTAFAFINNLDFPVYNAVAWAAALAVILVEQMWKKLPPDHPAVYRSPENSLQS